MAIADDISVASNGDVRYTGTTVNYTVIELHRFLQDLADDASAAGDDILDITFDTPSDRSTDNIISLLGTYNIDDTLAQHLYDGSIIQASGNTIYDGIVNFGAAGIHIEIIQNGALVTPNFWTSGINADPNAGISHRFLVKTRDAGADIDGRRLIGTARELGKTYTEFRINGTARGNNVLALTHSTDLNNLTAEATISTFSISNIEGYNAIDVNNDGTPEYYYSQWDKGVHSINDFYEYGKYLTRRGTAETVYGLNGALFRGITHEIDISSPSGTFVEPESLSWTGGTGQLLAIDSTTAGTKIWMQILTGTAPSSGTITGNGGATATIGTVTDRSVSIPFIGQSTSSSLIGGYGVGLKASTLTASDKLFDLTNTQLIPPNNVAFTVGGLVSGEDRVLVAPESGGVIEVSQLSAAGVITAGATSVIVNEAIPSDTPPTGTIRIYNGDTYIRVPYTSWSGSTFSGTTNVPDALDSANIWISYIDELASSSTASFTSVYLADRSLYIRVRDGAATPIKTFATTGTLGSAGGSTTAIRTSDE